MSSKMSRMCRQRGWLAYIWESRRREEAARPGYAFVGGGASLPRGSSRREAAFPFDNVTHMVRRSNGRGPESPIDQRVAAFLQRLIDTPATPRAVANPGPFP